MLGRFAKTEVPSVAQRTTLACLLSSEPVGDLQQLVGLADVAVRSGKQLKLAHRGRGLAAYRAGDWEGALHWCGLIYRDDPTTGAAYKAHAFLVEAMALHRLQKPTEANDRYQEAVKLMEQSPTNEALDRAVFELLRREAAELIRITENEAPTQSAEIPKHRAPLALTAPASALAQTETRRSLPQRPAYSAPVMSFAAG